MKKSLLLSLLLIFLFCTFIFTLMLSYSKTMFNNISNDFLRLHIIANSDSKEDQMIKYEIRDAVLQYMSPYLENVSDKNSAIEILNKHIDELEKIATNISEKNGYNLPINLSISNCYFPAKTYGNITLPEGNYDALKIEIGKSEGQNWWCVMYPCLCIIDSSNSEFSYTSEKMISNKLGIEEYSLITESDDSKALKFKFKLVELFENL